LKKASLGKISLVGRAQFRSEKSLLLFSGKYGIPYEEGEGEHP